METKTRQPFYDLFKAVLIFCVVAGHGIETGIAGSTVATSATYLFFYLFHMPAFLFLLGFFSKSTAASSRKIGARVGFFLVLYVLAKVLYYGGFKLITGALPAWTNASFFAEDALPWYMLSAAFFMASLWLARKLPAWIMLPVFTLIGLFSGAIPEIKSFLCLNRTLVFCPFFLLGYYFPKGFFERLLSKKHEWYWLSVPALCAVWIGCWLWLSGDPARSTPAMSLLYGNNSYSVMGLSLPTGLLYRAVSYLAALVLTALVAMLAAGLSTVCRGDFLPRVGRNTLVPFLVHYPVFLFTLKVFGVLSFPAYIALVVLILALWSLDLYESAIRLIYRGFYAFFGLFRKKSQPTS